MATAPAPSAAGGGTTKATKSATKKPAKAGASKAKVQRKTKKAASTKSAAASSSQQAYAAARAAQMDLAGIRNDEAARRLDPLWYKPEDILPSIAEDTPMSEHPRFLPEQIQIVENALMKNNLSRSDVTPQAFACLLEQARRFAMEILTDSQDYAFVAGRTEIERSDLKLANEFRPDHPIAVSTQLPKLNLLAQTVNRMPLPPIPTHCYSGVVLPSKNHQLTARTFDVVTSAQTARRMVQAAPPPPHKAKAVNKKPSSGKEDKHKPSYGASRGRQIVVSLKKKEEPKKAEENKKEEETKKLEEQKKAEENKVAEESQKPPGVEVVKMETESTGVPAEVPGATKKEEDNKMDAEDTTPDTPKLSVAQIETPANAPASGNAAAPPAKVEPDATLDQTDPANFTKDDGDSAPMDMSPEKP
jgi:histone H3/H4